MPLGPSYPAAQIKLIVENSGLEALLVKDKDAFEEHRDIVKCPVLSMMNILDNEALPEPSVLDWRTPAPNTSCGIIHLRHNRKAQGRGTGARKLYLGFTRWTVAHSHGSRPGESVLALRPHDLSS